MTQRHLLIAGQGRSGSTLFFNMLRHTLQGFSLPHNEIRAGHVIDLPDSYCTKRPFDIFDIPNIVRSAASAGKMLDLVITLRDPRDILTSRHRRVPDDYFYAADHSYFIAAKAATPTMPGFLQVHKAIMDVTRSGLFPRGIFFLKYEDLVENPDAIQSALAQGFGLEFQGSVRDFDKQHIPEELDAAMNGVRALETTRRAKWRAPEHRARIIDQFTRFPVLHDILISLGYEADQTWFDALLDGEAMAS